MSTIRLFALMSNAGFFFRVTADAFTVPQRITAGAAANRGNLQQ
jgi:hypothetical protein